MSIRDARPEEAGQIAALVNAAYEVERFFVAGNRTSAEEVRAAIAAGAVLVGVNRDGIVAATVQVEVTGIRASFGMLAVAPDEQRQGWGARLVDAAERRARDAGARTMEIRVVDVREELFPRYARLGYLAVGTETYVHRPVSRPVHFVVMEKSL